MCWIVAPQGDAAVIVRIQETPKSGDNRTMAER
jgi:hypothetical protein